MGHDLQRFVAAFSIAALVLSLLVPLLIARSAHAAEFTELSLRADRMKVSEADVDYLVVIKPAATGTEAKVKVTFAAGYNVDSTASNITTTT